MLGGQRNAPPYRWKLLAGLIQICMLPLLVQGFSTLNRPGAARHITSLRPSIGFRGKTGPTSISLRRGQSELNLMGLPEFFSSGLTEFFSHGLPDSIHQAFSSNLLALDLSSDALDSTISVAAERRMSETAFLDSLGHDVLVFLATTVVVVPLSRYFGVTPVLGFLAAGFLLGPFGLQVFGNTEADLQLGDFGILFLLFAEGLNLSPDRVKRLGAFGTLGVVQLLASMGLLFVGLLAVGPYILQNAPSMLNLDKEFLSVFESPAECFCLAAAGALSSSAFVLPILKEKGWEDRPEGIAALSVLLLQDLAVAPLLIILPLIAGAGPQSSTEFMLLAAKGTVGFAAVLYFGSWLLKKIFDVVAAARSTETFVAAALLVAVGMGQAADFLGLSATTGAFAAGVLLANNKYRAQIKADVQPFEGLLLGIFFVTAGASLDPAVILSDFPTLMFGILSFIIVKALVLWLAGPVLGNSKAQAARVAITLAGGGEFSLVLLNLARELGVIPSQLSKLLLASVIISMSLTPLLGEVAEFVSNYLESRDDNISYGPENIGLKQDIAGELFQKIDADGSGTIEYEELRKALLERGLSPFSVAEIFESFDADDSGCITREEWEAGMAKGYLDKAISHAPGTLVELKDLDVEVAKDAIVICGYTEFGREMYRLLEAAGCAKNGGLVAFDLNPSRVAAGLLAGVNVVYGNGASPELLRAAGVKSPKGVVVAFRSEAQLLEATARLREFLPEGTPIYSREISGQSVTKVALSAAGATDVVSERTESALRFGVLLGVIQESKDMAKYRNIISPTDLESTVVDSRTFDSSPVPGVSLSVVDALCDEFSCSRLELTRLYNIFYSLPDTDGDPFVRVDELEEVYLRRSKNPITDDEAEKWLEKANRDGGGYLSFVDFARVYLSSVSQGVEAE